MGIIQAGDSELNEAYQQALRYGSRKNDRIPVMIVGQDRAGKTSLRKRLLGLPHNPNEPSTVGIQVEFVKLSQSSSKLPWRSEEHSIFLANESEAEDALCKEGARFLREISKSFQTEEEMEEQRQDANETHSRDPTIVEKNLLSHRKLSETYGNENDEEPSQAETISAAPESSKKARKTSIVPESLTTSWKEGDVEPPKPKNNSARSESATTYKKDDEKHYNAKMSFAKPKSLTTTKITIDERPSVFETEMMLGYYDRPYPKTSTIRMVVHDLAGQAIYYDTHYLFLKAHCPYILVHDLTKPLDQTAKPRFKPEFKPELNLNNPLLASNLDHLLLWLNLLSQLRESESQDSAKSLGFALPPVVVVLTNADRFEGNIEEVKARIRKVIEGKFQNVFPVFHVIDNTTTSGKEDPINKLRGQVFDLCEAILEKEQPMPIRWLQFETALRDELFYKSKRNYISVNEAKEISGKCKVESFEEALTFLHRQGMVVYYKHCPYVVLDPLWLMNLFTEVITVPEESKPIDEPYHHKLRENGILMQGFLKTHPHGQLLEDMMQRVSLMCPLEYEGKPAFLIPSVAPFMKKGESVVEKLKKSPIASLFIIFLAEFIPPGVFTRLQVKLTNKCRGIPSIDKPKLFCNYTVFPLQFSYNIFDVYLIQLIEKIKIGVVHKRGIVDKECFTQFASHLKSLLEECLDDIKSDEPLFYRGLRYEFGVKCTACVDVTDKKPCRRHDKVPCEHDECAHVYLLSEIEKMSAQNSLWCRTSEVESLEFDLERVKPWLYAGGGADKPTRPENEPSSEKISDNAEKRSHSEDAGPSSGKTKKACPNENDHDESEPSTEADDRSISDLHALTILKLGEILDIQVTVGNDYRYLAANFYMHINDIARISQKGSGRTEAVLRWAGQNRENTVGKLKEILVVMERDDCVQIINEDTE